MSNNPKLATEQQVKDVSDTFTEIINHQGKQIKALESGVIDAIEPSSPAPTKRGEYKVTKVGVYINFKDANGQPISVTEEDYSSGNVSIIFNGTDNRKLVVPITFEGEIKEGDTRGTTGDAVARFIQKGNTTYDLTSRTELAKEFISRVKNIYIISKLPINKGNIKLTYVGLNNTTYQKVTIQLIYTDETGKEDPVNFYIPKEVEIISLPNKIMKALVREGRTEFGKETEVYFEFYDFNYFPTEKIIIPTHYESKLLPDAFPSEAKRRELENTHTFSIIEGFSKTYPILNTVKNIYVKSELPIRQEDIKVSYFAMNEGGRHFLIQLVYKKMTGVSFILHTSKAKPKGGEIIKLPYKELINEFGEKTDVYIEFQDFEEYPTDSFLVANDLYRFKLTSKAFDIPVKANLFIDQKTSNSNSNKKHTVIKVNPKDGGYNAIQNAIDKITDATENNTYEIIVAQGIYEATNGSQYKGHLVSYPAFICPKDYVSITGVNKRDCIVKASLPWNDSEIDTSVNRNMFQTIYNYAHESTMTRLTIVAENIRYTLHQDSGNEAFKKRYYVDCDMIWRGNKGSFKALGIGTFSGSETYFIGGRSICENSSPFAIHNNQAFTQISIWSFTNYEFLTYSGSEVMVIQNSGSLLQDLLEFKGCSFGGAYTFTYRDWWIYTHGLNDHYNHAEWSVQGSGNAPVFFNNIVEGYSLAIKSKTTGELSKVRFKGGTAYDLLVRNSKANKFGHIGHPERFIVNNEYIAFDGGGDFNGYAIGCVGIREKDYLYGTKVSAEPLGKRLGDCSILNKNLMIEVDGINKVITFNKDYTLKSNLEIITEINSVIADVAEAYITNVGADYYLEFTDVNYTVRNYHNNKSIPKGTIVTLREHALDVCGEFDKPYGMLIDDLKPHKLSDRGIASGYGRVIKNCYITTTKGNISSVRTSGIGTNYKIVDGVLVADPNGTMKSMAGLILI